MHLYSERTVTHCPRCLKWFMDGRLRCAVKHHGDGCCHYGDTEVAAPVGAEPAAEYAQVVGGGLVKIPAANESP
jgi:hypothetical protein